MTDIGLLKIGRFYIETDILILICLLLVACVFDVRWRRIPNFLILFGLATSFTGQVFLTYGQGVLFWLTGMIVGFAFFFPLYLIRAMGAGDVKLVAMIGSFLGPAATCGAVLVIFLAGGVFAISAAWWMGMLRKTLKNVRLILTSTMIDSISGQRLQINQLPVSKIKLPYALAVATGTLIQVFLARGGYDMVVHAVW